MGLAAIWTVFLLDLPIHDEASRLVVYPVVYLVVTLVVHNIHRIIHILIEFKAIEFSERPGFPLPSLTLPKSLFATFSLPYPLFFLSSLTTARSRAARPTQCRMFPKGTHCLFPLLLHIIIFINLSIYPYPPKSFHFHLNLFIHFYLNLFILFPLNLIILLIINLLIRILSY